MSLPDPDQTLGSPKGQQDDWKGLKLSLERPYKDDKGEKIRTLLDIENDKFIFEELVSLSAALRSSLICYLQKRVTGRKIEDQLPPDLPGAGYRLLP
jgi:hypothetical protein